MADPAGVRLAVTVGVNVAVTAGVNGGVGLGVSVGGAGVKLAAGEAVCPLAVERTTTIINTAQLAPITRVLTRVSPCLPVSANNGLGVIRRALRRQMHAFVIPLISHAAGLV